jgi:hypothetical protein
MSRFRAHFRRHRTRYAGTAAAAIIIIGAAIGTHVGTKSHVPYTPTTVQTLMWFLGERDHGYLPPRNTWCSLVRSSEHCYLLQESSGDAADTGTTGGWALTPTGSPRQGVEPWIPVGGGAVIDPWSETGVWFDGQTSGTRYLRTTGTVTNLPSSTNLVSITVVWSAVSGVSGYPRVVSVGDTGGIYELMLNLGNVVVQAQGSVTTKFFSAVNTWSDIATHCMTAVFDGRSVNAGAIYVDGTDETPASPDLSGTGTWQSSTGRIAIGNYAVSPGDALTMPGANFRTRLDFASMSLTDHRTICGPFWSPPSDATNAKTKVAAADVSWTQTGGARCFANSGQTATCVPGGSPGFVYSPLAGWLGWPLEPTRTNRVIDSVELSSGNWGGTAAPVVFVAPDNSKTAWDMTLTDAITLNQAVTGYTASVSLDLRFWANCSGGTLRVQALVGSGDWSMNCSSWFGWRELYDTDSKVTVNTPFQADSSGNLTIEFLSTVGGISSGPVLWLPTLTEAAGLSTIPTNGSAVATGDIGFTVTNNGYYDGTKGKVTVFGHWYSGGCVDITSGTNVGRQYSDAVDWFAYNSTPAVVYQCDMPLAGLDTAVIRWNSEKAVSGGLFAECLLNGTPQSWDVTPSSGWTSATPSGIELAGQGATKCTAILREIKVVSEP